MTEQERYLIQQIQQWLDNQEAKMRPKNHWHLESDIYKTLSKMTNQSFNSVSKDFVQNPILKQYLDKQQLPRIQFWLLAVGYQAKKEEVGQEGENLTLLNELIEKTFEESKKHIKLYNLRPTIANIKTQSFAALMTPSLLKTLYLLNDDKLTNLLKTYFPQPKAIFFANNELPDIVEADFKDTIKAIAKVQHIKKQTVDALEQDTKLIQRRFRKHRRHQEEVLRLTERYYLKEPKNAQDLLLLANKPYQPQCADAKLSQRLVALAANIQLFSKVYYPTTPSGLRDVLEQGLYGDITAKQFYLDRGVTPRGLEKEGQHNAIIMGINKLHACENNAKGIELVFDVAQLTQDNPNIYYQQMDFSIHGLFRYLRIGSHLFKFSLNVDSRLPRDGYTLMQWGSGNENRFAEIKNCLLSSSNLDDMHQTLILNFFRFIDALQTPDYKNDPETSIQIYAALNELADDALRETLIQIGSLMTDTALFNIHGAHEVELSSLLTIRFKNYNLSIPALIKSLQQGDLSIWLEAKEMLPELFSSYRFMNYLLSAVHHEKSLVALQKQAAICELPRLLTGLQGGEAKEPAPQASSVQAQKLDDLVEKASCDSKFAFLIEGATSSHPEITAAEALAHVTNSMIFDPVNHSTDAVLINVLIRAKQDSEAHGQDVDKALALIVIAEIMVLGFRTSWLKLEGVIQYHYKLALQTDVLPEWLATLQVEKLPELIKYFNITRAEILAAMEKLEPDLSYSNKLIPAKIIELLNANANLTSLIGLWGEFHLAAFEGELPPGVQVCIKEQAEGYRHLQLTVGLYNPRTVDVHLFGGAHGCLQGYQRLEQFAKEHGLISKQYKAAVGYIHHKDAQVKPDHHYFNVTWGRLAEFFTRIAPLETVSKFTDAWYLFMERSYGFLDQKLWTKAFSWDHDLISLRKKMLANFKPWLVGKIIELSYIDGEFKQRIVRQLDKLFMQEDGDAFKEDLNVFIELVSAIQLFPTHGKADIVEKTLVNIMWPDDKKFPIELIQEYAGLMTSSQMRFFAPKDSNESASSSNQMSPVQKL